MIIVGVKEKKTRTKLGSKAGGRQLIEEIHGRK